MYAIIRTGGKQAKVQAGDVLDVERLRADGDQVTFAPLLVVEDDGTVHSGRDELADAQVTATVLGGSLGPKVDVFKYRAKTGYRRRQGHRQKYTQIRVDSIDLKKPAKKAAAKPKAEKADADKADTEPKAAAQPKAEKAAPKPKADKPADKPAAKPKAAAKEAEPDVAEQAAADAPEDETNAAKEA